MFALFETRLADPMPADDDQLDAWVERVRGRLSPLLEPWPEPVPLDVEVTESVETPSYRRDRIVYDTEAHMSVPAYLLTPHSRTAPGPAILAIHGHGPGKSQVVGLEHTEMPNADYGHRMAEAGYVVLAPDLRCFGERTDYNPEGHYSCDTNLVHAYMAGVSPLTENLFDLRRSLDVLQDNDLVDPTKIGAIGISYGGTCTLFLAAIDQRVAASVVSGYFSSWGESHKVPWNMCGSQVVASLIAPRPLLIESGTEDFLFPWATAADGVRQLKRLYAHLGNPGGVAHDIFEGDHQWHGVDAYPFLEDSLR
jgi:dienelactone hydrolase